MARLNPFAFPSETSLRYALLIVFAVCGSLSLYGTLWGVFHPQEHRIIRECALAVSREGIDFIGQGRGPGQAASDDAMLHRAQDAARDAMKCFRTMASQLQWKAAGTALTLGLALAIYWLLPAWRIRRNQLQPLSAADAPDVVLWLSRLCRELALARRPVFLWNPLNPRVRASAFGRLGRHYVALSGGLVAQFYSDQTSFRAVLLHELAHLRNADVDKTYLTIAVFCAFVATPLIPATVALCWPGMAWNDRYSALWDLLLSTVLVLVSGASVLRVREHYADVRASVWDKTSLHLDRVLSALPALRGSRWLALVRLHPEPGARRQILADTYSMFPLSPWDAMGVGIATASVIDSMKGIVFVLVAVASEGADPLDNLWVVPAIELGIPLIVLPLAVGAVGIGVWRGAFAALIMGRCAPNAGRLGLGLAGGLILMSGIRASAMTVASVADGGIASDWVPLNWIWMLAEALVLLVILYLVFHWIADSVNAWLHVVLQSRSPRPLLFASISVCLGLLVLWTVAAALAPMFLTVLLGLEIKRGTDFYVYGLLIGPLIMSSAILVWAFPLGSAYWHRRTDGTVASAWIFLDGVPDHWPQGAALRVGAAMKIGLISGLICCLVLGVIYFRNDLPADLAGSVKSSFDWALRAAEQTFGSRGIAIPMLAVICQASAAALAAAGIKVLSVVHGLFAAFIAGVVSVIGIYLQLIVGGVESSEALLILLVILGMGTLLVLPAAIIGSQVGAGTRRLASLLRTVRTLPGA